MTPGPVLVLGATSGIARETALALARRGHPLVLAGRDEEELVRLARDAQIRTGQRALPLVFDAQATERADETVRAAVELMGELEGVVWAVGYLGDQARAEQDPAESERIARLNYLDAVPFLLAAAAYLEGQGKGWIVGIGSVAGDRGRRSNYAYGSAKAGLAVFLQGLRLRMADAGVRVVTVKPGPVDTGMTFGAPKLPLLADPKAVGERIARAARRGATTVYVPAPWRLVMAVLRALPEPVFRRLRL